MRCPSSGTAEQRRMGLQGCGSSRVAGPDEEGLYDCLDCGLWFEPTITAKHSPPVRRRA